MNDPENPAILVVDDDPAVLDSYRFILSVAGYRPVLALNTAEAQARLIEDSPPVALVDLKIKNENGIETASVLKQMDPFIEVIIITGYPSHETAVRALKIGAFDYLAKSSETETILDAIREAQAHRDLTLFQRDAAGYREGDIGLVVVCNNTFTRHGLLQFLARSRRFQLTNFFASVPMLRRTPGIDRASLLLVCTQCCFRDEEEALTVVGNLHRDFPALRIILFNADYPPAARIELVKRGAAGFLETNRPEPEMEKMLLDIHRGEICVPPAILSRAVAELSDFYTRTQLGGTAGAEDPESALTTREKEILRCLALGKRNKAIGDELFISEKTVKTHINNIFRKLGAETRLQALHIAYEKKILF